MLTCVTVLPLSTPAVFTATGTRLRVVELFPSCPWLLYPQQYVAPEATTHVDPLPEAVVESVADICVTVLPLSTPAVLTATGTLLCVVELFPSCPWLLYPQQYAAPLLSTAHECAPPTAISTIVFPLNTPLVFTATGTELLLVELFPSCPWLLYPQQ